MVYYTIPRTVRELQQKLLKDGSRGYYTIPRTVRELQHFGGEGRSDVIIPYQELLGNYNDEWRRSNGDRIIPYQELLGNYNQGC